MCRVLVETNKNTYSPLFVELLRNSAKHLSLAGDSAGALAAAEESVTNCKKLAEERGPEAYIKDLALSLNVLSICQTAAENGEQALASASESVEVNRELVKTSPGGSDPNLAESLQTLSICLEGSGQTQAALVAIKESVEIFRRLYGQYPKSFRSLLADALDVLRDCLQAMGKTGEAVSVEEEAHRLRD